MLPLSEKTTDTSIRTAVFNSLIKAESTNPASIVSELSLANTGTRADLAVIGDHLHGYELKSDIDSLQRLKSQIQGYNAVFDKVTLVVGRKHLLHSIFYIPEWWGIVLAKIDSEGKLALHEIREAISNPKQDLETMLRLLRKNEVVKIFEQTASNKKHYYLSKTELCEILLDSLSASCLKKYVRMSLAKRVLGEATNLSQYCRDVMDSAS